MMNRIHEGPAGAPVTAEAHQATGTFLRSDAASATLDIEYQTQDSKVTLPADNLAIGVAQLCRTEIASMRASLGQLGEELAGQLHDDGKNPVITRHWHDRDERTWKDSGERFAVHGSTTRLSDTLRGYEGASDARLVRAHVRLAIEQREQSIRNVYGQILTDARARRGNPQAAPAGAHESNP